MPAKNNTHANSIAKTVKIVAGQLTYEIEIAVPPMEIPVTLDIANGLVHALKAIIGESQPTETELMNGAAVAVLALALTARDQRSAFKSLEAAFGGVLAQRPRPASAAKAN